MARLNFEMTIDKDSREVLLNVRDLKKNTKKGIKRAFFNIGKDYKKKTIDLMKEPKSGRLYLIKINKQSRFNLAHRASAPGEAPAILTGQLKRSVNYNVRGSSELIFGAGNDDKVTYAKGLENGTSKVKPRPYLLPSIESNRRNTENRFVESLEKEIKS